MMSRTLLLVMVMSVLPAGCILPGDAAGTSGIHGQALIGPTCPVETDPPEPGCEDRPYKGTLAVTSADGETVVKEFETAQNGTFRVPVPPGNYQIRHANGGAGPPSCATNETIAVAAGDYTWVFVHCDSGIR